MKKAIFILIMAALGRTATAQKVDSIYFNLYTDSLKKGTYNYINVEGRLTDGRYLPLGEKELRLTSSAGEFSGNSLFIDSSFSGEKITVKAVLIADPSFEKQVTVYIKKLLDNGPLPTVDEILGHPAKNSRSRHAATRN